MLSVEYQRTKYVLNNLSDQRIREFIDDPKTLDSYFLNCLKTGENIIIAEDQNEKETLPTNESSKSNVDVPQSCSNSNRVFHSSSGANNKPSTSKAQTANKKPSTSKAQTANNKPSTSKAQTANKKSKSENLKYDEADEDCFDELLVSMVMGKPALYDFTAPTSKSSGSKAEMWKDIWEELKKEFPRSKITIAGVKDKWSAIRNEYLKRKRKSRQGSGAGVKEPHVETLDDMLLGLNDIYELETTTSNVSGLPEDSDETPPHKVRKGNAKKIDDEALHCIEHTSEKFLSAISEMKNAVVVRAAQSNDQQNQGDRDSKFCEVVLLKFKELTEDEKELAEISILKMFRDIKQNRNG